ncbi:MAG: hypothetical protein Q8O34_13370 [Rhodocyclaceae bacterium]|nr:hypothetical protein [Rhodocyclaceae bacterium]
MPTAPAAVKTAPDLTEVDGVIERLEAQSRSLLSVDASLTRQLVSFQANKGRERYRWYKYKEGFSADLVEHFLDRCNVSSGKVLDPFAGSGTTLFAASGRNLVADGIELLPIGIKLMETRRLLEEDASDLDRSELRRFCTDKPWRGVAVSQPLHELRITNGAYPADTKRSIEQCLAWMETIPSLQSQVALFALLAILESVSFTRKDGQYLRWDYRSGRKQGSRSFDKGHIAPFDEAFSAKLSEIVEDVSSVAQATDLFKQSDLPERHNITVHGGSCLEVLSSLRSNDYDAIITSPPYCNRYDYTRTYALELALLGVDEVGLSRLRQEMLSCTVENRAKDLLRINPSYGLALGVAEHDATLNAVVQYLEGLKSSGDLNNNGIPRMVRGYFHEMACVIQECARVLKPGAPLVMVNDNVRYAGAAIPVDLILSGIARQLGFDIESILVLPNGKGNSSQQMGAHGRHALRKCVYLWRRSAHGKT